MLKSNSIVCLTKKLRNKRNSSGGASIDLHAKTVFEVRTTLAEQLYNCYCLGQAEVTIIHGYTHGADIKRYIWHQIGEDFTGSSKDV